MPERALLVVDVQPDFMPGGRLPVPDGEAVVAAANRLAVQFTTVVVTQDWHPAGHLSFATSHPGRAVFETVALAYGPQMLWPDHCTQGSTGAALHPGLDLACAGMTLRKGMRAAVDSYSAFSEADGKPTGLRGYLAERGIDEVVICGLATDFCVAWSALDARRMGLGAVVVDGACRGIGHAGSLERAWAEMRAAGVCRVEGVDWRP